MRKKGVVSLYVDGKLEVEQNIAANMDNPAPIKLGGWGTENLIGGIDEVFIFKAGIALTEKDLQSIMLGWTRVLAVSSKGKLATTWGGIKAQ